jgi:hypothetical protein
MKYRINAACRKKNRCGMKKGTKKYLADSIEL